jgi:protein TonB
MVPPEGIEKVQPTTLPADFGEWDSGEAHGTEPVEVPVFDRFPAPPAAKPAPKAATARVAVLPAAERPPVAPPRKPVKRYPDPEPVFELPKSQDVDAEDLEEVDESKGKRTKMLVGAGVLVLLLAGGAVAYKLNSKPATPAQPVATQPAPTAATSSSLTPLKPSPTTAPSTTPTETAPADTQETPAGLSKQSGEAMNRSVNAPSKIANDLQALGANQAAPTGGFSAAGMDGMGNSNPVFAPGNGPKVKVEPQRKVSISAGIAVGLLDRKTSPVYPPIAKSAHVSGTVVIQATISKSGSIENPHVVSGPTMLRQSALDAVKTWHFRPYLLDGQPVEVETTVNVVFNL